MCQRMESGNLSTGNQKNENRPDQEPKKAKMTHNTWQHTADEIGQAGKNISDDVRKLVQSGNQTLKDKLAIDLLGDGRHGSVKFDKEVYFAKLVDLPSILESHKTIDKKTFWKTADLCQMLVCSTDEPETPEKEEEKPKRSDKPDKVDKKFLWNHGITPPLKNVRKRRFRKTAKKKYIENTDIEDEVKRLLRMDSTAIKIRWEVLADEDIKDDAKAESSINSPAVNPAEGDDLRQIFDDLSSSDDNEEADINIEDLDEDTQDSVDTRTATMMIEENEYSNMSKEVTEEKEPEETNELAKRLVELKGELMGLEEKKRDIERSISTVENIPLKQRFQSQLEEVLQEMKKRQEEVETLTVIVGDV